MPPEITAVVLLPGEDAEIGQVIERSGDSRASRKDQSISVHWSKGGTPITGLTPKRRKGQGAAVPGERARLGLQGGASQRGQNSSQFEKFHASAFIWLRPAQAVITLWNGGRVRVGEKITRRGGTEEKLVTAA